MVIALDSQHTQALQVLTDLGLEDLAQTHIISASTNLPSTRSQGPTILVSAASEIPSTFSSFATDQDVLHIQALLPVKTNKRRAVCSGRMNSATLALVQERGVYYAGENLSAASHIALIEQTACAVQTALAAEAVALSQGVGVNPALVYAALAGGAGSSWPFKEYGQQMLGLQDGQGQPIQTLAQARDTLASALHITKGSKQGLPLAKLAHDIFSQSLLVGEADDCASRIGVPSSRHQERSTQNGHSITHTSTSGKPKQVGLIGLGAMGYGMANVLVRNGFNTIGYDAWGPSRERFQAGGGQCADSIPNCANGSEVLILMVVNHQQAEDVLIKNGAAAALPQNATVLLMCTISPSQVAKLAADLRAIRPDVMLVDAPVSGGTPRAASGDLTILCAGLDFSVPSATSAHAVLRALSGSQGNDANLILIPGGVGKGAAIKLINQHLAGCHILSVAESITLAARLKLPLRLFREIMLTGPGYTWMMGHRGGNMLDGLIEPPTSTIDIFVKDMGMVVKEAGIYNVDVPLAAQVEQAFLTGSTIGWGKHDDSSIVRLWAKDGVSVTGQ